MQTFFLLSLIKRTNKYPTSYNQLNYVDETPVKKIYCTCGESAKKPYCDGSHEMFKTGKLPIEFEARQAKRMAICDCRQSSKLPFCDGTHTKL